ncbi:MAG TPA: hypothetical protein DDY16_04470 [Tenacibaculum sp.]|nr:hypothetical protein [Tenacibaculum sp.]
MNEIALLTNLYTKPKFGVAFSSYDKLYRKAKEYNSDIKKETVKKFLRNRLSHSLFAKKIYKFKKRKIYCMNPASQVSVDLWELSNDDKRKNYPYKYLFCQIDNFSRLVQIFKLKSKTPEEIKKILKLSFSIFKPRSILCDREGSFFSTLISNFLKENNVKIYTQKSAPTLKWKNGMIERGLRTLKLITKQYCEEYGITRFVDHLKNIMSIYNLRVNRSTGYSPKELHFSKDAIADYQTKLSNELNQSAAKMEKGDLQLGDYVRFKVLARQFAKETEKTFSRSVHIITQIKKTDPLVYRIFPTPPDQDRFFYRNELFKIDKDFITRRDIPVEKVVASKKLPNGEKIYECALVGEKKREWLTLQSLKTRFILFPDADISTDLLQKTHNRSMITRKQQRENYLKDGVTTRSQTIVQKGVKN